mgnify:CR=1 FL=1
MKKILSIAAVFLLIFSMLVLSVSAQAENKLTATWVLGLAKDGTLTEETDTDGTKYISVTGIKNAWDSPTINVLDAIKSAAGDDLEDGADVYIVFDVRIQYAENADQETPITANALLRMKHELSSDEELFSEQYYGTLFTWNNTNIMHYFQTGLELSSEWTHFEEYLTVDSSEFEGAGTEWNLCIDTISDPEAVAALEFKNVGVYDYTYEPVEVEEPEEPEEPVEPTATPLPTAGQQTPVGLVKTTPTADAGTLVDDQNGGSNTTTIIVICVVAAVVIAAIIVGIAVAKKKRSTENPTEESPNNDKTE